MRYEIGSTGLEEPRRASLSEVKDLRAALDVVRRYLPAIGVEDWHRARRPGLGWLKRGRQ